MKITQNTSYEERRTRNNVYDNSGVPALTMATAAELTAILYVYGRMGDFMQSGKFRADYEWVVERYHVNEAGKMSEDFAKKYAEVVKQLESYNGVMGWVESFLERYNIEL